VDSFRLAKVRMDIHRWEEFVAQCYLVLKAMRVPCESLGTIYQELALEMSSGESRMDSGMSTGATAALRSGIGDPHYEGRSYKELLKIVCLDITIILDNFTVPQGWTRPQIFQLAVDVLIARSMDFVEVERIFDSRSPAAGDSIRAVVKVCNQFRATFEFAQKRNARLLGLAIEEDMTSDRLFGTLSAFVSRCNDLLEICVTNGQFMASASSANVDDEQESKLEQGNSAEGSQGGAANAAKEMAAVARRYRGLIVNIRRSGRRCLDIADEKLRSDFQIFKSEVHELDYALLRALKTSLENPAGRSLSIRESVAVLEAFFPVSKRERIKETYESCAANVIFHLIVANMSFASSCRSWKCWPRLLRSRRRPSITSSTISASETVSS